MKLRFVFQFLTDNFNLLQESPLTSNIVSAGAYQADNLGKLLEDRLGVVIKHILSFSNLTNFGLQIIHYPARLLRTEF